MGLGLLAGLFIYIDSAAFKEDARRFVVREIQNRTGAAVSLKRFDWSLRNRRFELTELILRGLEPRTGPPLAFFPEIRVGLNLRSLLQRRLNLYELTLRNPEFYVVVDAQGKTNFPTPPARGPRQSFDFAMTIDNFRIVEGAAAVNERRVAVELALSNVASEMSYRSATEVLSSHLHYDGQFVRMGRAAIPYTFDADLDYTRGTLLARRIDLTSAASAVRLQGRINDLLQKTRLGRLEYTGNVDSPFLNHFFPKEQFSGKATVAGTLEFSEGYFFTNGNAAADSINFDNWIATGLRSEYNYRYPDKRLAIRNLRADLAGGKAAGDVTIENIPGDSRVNLEIDYSRVDAAALARAYPWDPKYRVYSRLDGTLRGWFEGRIERYDFSGKAVFTPYSPPNVAGIVALPLEGTSGYEVRPGRALVTDSDVRFKSTRIKANGLIHQKASDLKVEVESTDLRDAWFIYGDANGSGSFSGTLTGPIQWPILNGDFSLRNHVYQKRWTVEHSAGHVRLDTLTQAADLRSVRIFQGRSEIEVTGTTELDGSPADLRIQAVRVYGEDLKPFVDRQIAGQMSGNLRLTSFSPMRVEGDLRAAGLQVDRRDVGNAQGRIRYVEPVIEVESASIVRNGSTLSGNLTFNRATEALKFAARVTSVDFDSIRWIGLPEALKGTMSQADLQGNGTLKQPNVRGTGTIQNLALKTLAFPVVRVDVTSDGSTIHTTINAARNLNLVARINTAEPTLPFSAEASFTEYSLEQLAGLSRGSLHATGTAAISGLLKDTSSIHGQGRIEAADAVIEGRRLRAGKPFTFDFNSDHLTLSQVTLSGDLTELSLAGTIGLTDKATLNLNVRGRLDLALLGATNPDLVSGGSVTLDGQVRGTAQNPDLRGIAHFANASFSKRGTFTSLSDLSGDLFFDENRITLNDMGGRMGGGTVRLQGNAVLRETQIQAMNIRIDTNDVRIRYPEGLRTVVAGTLVLRGSWDAPLLEGNLEIQSMAYRSSFDEFLAMFRTVGLDQGPSPFGHVRLAAHVEGGKNITIQNQLADLQARVDLDIKGTVDRPALTGHVEASGGTLAFQGKRYTITRGNVDFVDPLRIEPVVDLQAETELRDYRVILTISGHSDRLRLTMSSDPPLPQLDIVNLVAGGKTREELAAGGNAGATSEQVFQGRAYSILTDLLQERIGDKFGISNFARVRIDPFVVGSQNQRSAWLTVEKQLTKDLSVTYSQDLSSSNRQQNIVQIEYFVSGNTSVIGTRDETGQYSLDVKFRKRIK